MKLHNPVYKNTNSMFGSAISSSKGFTLIEVMVAVLIAGLTLLPTLDVLVKGYSLTNRQMDEGFALNLADSALNVVKTSHFKNLHEAFAADKTINMEIKFPGDTVATKFNLPLGKEKTSFKGVKLTHDGSNTDYFVKVELKRIAGESDGVSTKFKYGKCGFSGGVGVNVATFTADYTTDEEIFTVWSTVTCVAKNSERKFILSTCISDLGS